MSIHPSISQTLCTQVQFHHYTKSPMQPSSLAQMRFSAKFQHPALYLFVPFRFILISNNYNNEKLQYILTLCEGGLGVIYVRTSGFYAGYIMMMVTISRKYRLNTKDLEQ